MATRALPDLESQYAAVREAAGLLARDRGFLELAGTDAGEFLQGQVTNDVQALGPGQGCYALLLNPKGRILADARVLARSTDEFWLDTEPEALDKLRSNLEMYKIGRQVEVADRSGERALLSLIGPRSRALADIALPQAEGAQLEAAIAGTPVVAVATDTGVDLITEPAVIDQLSAELDSRGAAPVGAETAEIVRIESGRPRFGIDMGEENLPGEMGLEERAVSFTKGCYVGQEPVARMYHRGHPNRLLRGLRLSAPAAVGDPLLRDAKGVGTITSACVSPRLGPIALAVVRREVEPGEEVRVGDRASGTVVELPFDAGAGEGT
jgi:folate-binding protein YgfZ